MCGCCSQFVFAWSLIIGGLLVAIIAIVYGAALPKVIDTQIRDGVVLCQASDYEEEAFLDAYGDCDDCAPYYYAMNLYNATNAEAYLAGGVKLQLQETGPYVYRRRQMRLGVEFDPEDTTRVSYKQYTYHTFEPELSCDGCLDTDEFVSFDVGYLNVIALAGGEAGFLTRLAYGSYSQNASSVAQDIAESGQQMMRWVNGLNSLDPAAMKNVVGEGNVLKFLTTGPAAIADLDLSGFVYNGLFVKRTANQWALGYPSMLAGLGLGSNFVTACNVTGGYTEQCDSCEGDACLDLWYQCYQCSRGASVVGINNVTCGIIEDIYAAEYGAEEAATFRASTCDFCDSIGLCAAPLPGIAEDSGLDYSKSAPPASVLNTYTQLTGCDDDTKIGEYEVYNGYSSIAIWVNTLTERRNPTQQEIIDFVEGYGNCANPTANLTCSVVQGNDATAVPPGGANIMGFADDVTVSSSNMYLDYGKQNITLYSTGEDVKFSGITMHRFGPPSDLLNASSWKDKGTGYPVDGVQPMAFTVGFLAYVSYPLFIYGNSTLLDDIEVTMFDGVVASYATLYDASGALKDEYAERYVTYINVEAGTGKTMVAHKRLMASYALSRSVANESLPISDVLWPDLEPEIIFPAYYGEEYAELTSKQSDYYHLVARLLASLLPVLIVGAVLGLALFAWGVVYRRRHVSLAVDKSPAGAAI